VVNDLETKFFNEFYRSRFVDAFNTALERVAVHQMLGVTDTTYYFFAGFAALAQSEIDNSMWAQSIEKFERALELGYSEVGENQGQIYNLLFTAYMGMGNPEAALSYAKTGFEKNPGYVQLMYALINFYLEREENALALEYLDHAISREPRNAVLQFAKGRVLDELGESEKAIEAYEAAIAIDPTYFDPHFNKAVVFYNEAIRIVEEANEARTQAEYDRLRVLAEEAFYKAIGPMEKAHELNPTDLAVIETLRSLYLRLRVRFPDFEAKFEEMNRKLEELR
jgi:tetratricopeptide (TPR) repeat protein